jgi:hypothetical protein
MIFFPQQLKPQFCWCAGGAAEAAPFQSRRDLFSELAGRDTSSAIALAHHGLQQSNPEIGRLIECPGKLLDAVIDAVGKQDVINAACILMKLAGCLCVLDQPG